MGKILKKINHKNYIFFVSGVSDSKTTNINDFNREKNLLLETIKKNNQNKKLIYMSTCDIYDNSKIYSPYLKHKCNMENIITKNCDNWIIFRVSQVIGVGGNKNNLLYKLCSYIANEHKFVLYPLYERNLICIKDLQKIIINYLNHNNKIINIANPANIKVKNLIHIIEKNINKKAMYDINLSKNSYQILLDKNFPLELFDINYYENKIKCFVSHFIKNK